MSHHVGAILRFSFMCLLFICQKFNYFSRKKMLAFDFLVFDRFWNFKLHQTTRATLIVKFVPNINNKLNDFIGCVGQFKESLKTKRKKLLDYDHFTQNYEYKMVDDKNIKSRFLSILISIFSTLFDVGNCSIKDWRYTQS